MTAVDAFTAACPLFRAAQARAGRNGAAFQWTGRGSWFRNPLRRPSTHMIQERADG